MDKSLGTITSDSMSADYLTQASQFLNRSVGTESDHGTFDNFHPIDPISFQNLVISFGGLKTKACDDEDFDKNQAYGDEDFDNIDTLTIASQWDPSINSVETAGEVDDIEVGEEDLDNIDTLTVASQLERLDSSMDVTSFKTQDFEMYNNNNGYDSYFDGYNTDDAY